MRFYLIFATIVSLLFLASCSPAPKDETEKKVDDLLSQMTLDEKIGQMTQICFSEITLNGDKNLDMHPELFRQAILENHVGSFLSGTGPAQKWIDFISTLQKMAVEETRLGIPLLIGIDHIHGANYVDEGTMLPHNITLSCSFDPDVVSRAARVTAIETADLGMSWNFAPVVDLGKNAYWPRLYETFGEDPLVCGILGSSFITTYQDPEHSNPYKLAACAKHFIGYSDPRTGHDRTPAEIPDQILYEHHLPAFVMALESGVKTVMVNSGEVNGIPGHVSEKLLKGLLREKLGFDGVILSDIKDISKVYNEHHGAFSEKDATLRAINAGIDMSMSCNSYLFIDFVKELIAEGKLTESRIDESVKRILRLKFDLGLFDNPYPRNDRLNRMQSDEHLQTAYYLAEQSIVLLKNQENVLPIRDTGQRILVTGFAAHSRKMLNGAWTLEWLGAEEERQPKNMNTLFDALATEFPNSDVSLLEIMPDGTLESEKEYRAAVVASDYVIITLGEEPYSEFKGNINDLQLTEPQKKLAQIAGEYDKKLVFVLIQGRPRLITDIEPLADGILFAGYPGQGGADALAAIISGKANPSGKLSFSYPKHPNHVTPYYHKAFQKNDNLWDFGHGLSYTSFEYKNIEVDLSDDGKQLTLNLDISNSGTIAGKETFLLFFRQEKGTITRPVKKLFHFGKIELQPGETHHLNHVFTPSEIFVYPDENNNQIFEPGSFTIMAHGLEATIDLP